ncbi:MAG: hypothetical protein HY433_02090 [Candidatus Liptonbacteria bacterium]|nr:hypothetical protein [Candidatus Liptonbacteria bacterium]
MIQKEKLESLYVRERKSMQDIANILGCSLHKVKYWMEKQDVKARSISDAIYLKCNPHGDPFHIKEVKTLNEAKLLGLGLGLYWGEGNKKNKNSIRLGNTDPEIIKNFIRFLTVIFGIDTSRLKFGLQIFSDMPGEKILRFWIDKLKEFHVSRKQFFKITVTPHRGVGNYKEKSKTGVLTVYFGNVKLKKFLDGMLPR